MPQTDEIRVHITDVRAFKSCRRKWGWSSPLKANLRPKYHSKNLWLGRGVHEALAAYYDPEDPYPRHTATLLGAFDAWAAEEESRLVSMVLSDKQRESIDDSIRMGQGMLRHYAEWAKENDDFEVLIPEAPLRVELPFFPGKNVVYVGRADGLVKKKNKYWVLEHKTCASYPAMDMLFLDEQCIAYIWATNIDPRYKDTSPIGTIYTFLLKKLPHIPRQLKAGGLERRKNMKTTYAVYLARLKELGLPTSMYGDILARLKLQENPFFYRTYIKRTDAAMASFGTWMLATIREMLDPMVVLYPCPDWFKCKYCAFRLPCQMIVNGIDPAPILESDYVVREGW